MINKERKISRYIDQLNSEKMPKEHKAAKIPPEYEKLLETVRSVHSLKETALPDEDYQNRLLASLREEPSEQVRRTYQFTKQSWIFGAVAVAAALILFTSLNVKLPFNSPSIVSAMEQALKEVQAYHGILEVVETNELGERMTQSKREIWADKAGDYYIRELEGFSKGQITVNNGWQKWQIRPEEEKAYIFEGFPDPYRFTFELGKEVEEVKNALTVKEIGEEMIAGRKADILEITPEGGEPYRLWIDQETDLPLQRQSAMQNALQYQVTYTDINFTDTIPDELLTYSLPKGYEEINTDPEQFINTIEEAESIAGFTPIIPENLSKGYGLKGISVNIETKAVKLYYNTSDNKQTVIILQSKVKKEFTAASDAILGSVNNNQAEVFAQTEAASIRWQEQGYEYLVLGNTSLVELSLFAKELTKGEVRIPTGEENIIGQPQIEVPVDLVTEENDQKSVDAGHSPWKLDPAFVAQVFVSLLILPEGVKGDYPIPYEDVKITANTGTEAIAQVRSEITPARYVYLKRLIRQDETGIWTVVGYDPVD